MEAQVWTLIGLLGATLLGAFVYLGNRIDSLGSEMRGQFQGQGARIDALSNRVEDLGTQLADRIYELAVKLDDHLRWHAS